MSQHLAAEHVLKVFCSEQVMGMGTAVQLGVLWHLPRGRSGVFSANSGLKMGKVTGHEQFYCFLHQDNFFFKFCWSSQEGVVKIKLAFLARKYCPNSFTCRVHVSDIIVPIRLFAFLAIKLLQSDNTKLFLRSLEIPCYNCLSNNNVISAMYFQGLKFDLRGSEEWGRSVPFPAQREHLCNFLEMPHPGINWYILCGHFSIWWRRQKSLTMLTFCQKSKFSHC